MTADSHVQRAIPRASSSFNEQLSETVRDGSPTTHFHETSCGNLSAADDNDVCLPTAMVDDEIRDQNRSSENVLSSNKSFPDNSESHNKATVDRVLDGFPRHYFREASCISFDDLPKLDVENNELKVEGTFQKVQETNLPSSDKFTSPEEQRGDNVEVDEALVISAAEQCVDATVFGQHLAIASHINEEAPKFWHLHNGVLDAEMTQNIDVQYKNSLSQQNIAFGGRNHAQLFCFNDLLLYVRKRSTSITPCIIRVSSNNQCSVVAHIHLPNSYFCVSLPEPESPTGPFSMYVVRDGVLEQRSADMDLLRTIEVPKLTEEVPNLSSNAGKKRLLSYVVAVTEDRRYFVIVCPTAGGKSGRYLDVVDLKNNCYLHRSGLDTRFVWKVLEDGVYYLVRSAGSDNFELVTVRTVKEGTQGYDYCCITQSDLQIRSPDGQYGVELTPDHSIHIWKTVSTVEQTETSLEHLFTGQMTSDQPTSNKDVSSSTVAENALTPDQMTPTRQPTDNSSLEHNADQMTSDQTASNTDSGSATVKQNASTAEQLAATLEHCCVLSGHVAEVTCVSWASAESRLFVSGSRDNTVRLWSLDGGGSQLCLFHVLGTIDNVHFDETSRYVVAHCSYAPQRKRAIILKLTNVLT